ncbi:uncharacterized protein LOC109094692 isoform X2 [Cyprinus carpio]|uniref:Uncharacterized protein LOC109094692 isoform X2 n=1 Tax=Cyprinus carpio TaxID=7962 RepID=A0A9Q9WMT8_CYPCA|nr:uncharacterized protein LOC109094692 isoform X2 [Cyprinus carpio]
MDTRTEDPVHGSKKNKKRHIQRTRSPLRYTRPYRPRFEGKNLHSRFRFFRTMEERRFIRRPNFALRYQRHHTYQWSSLQLRRKPRASSPSSQQFDKGLNKNSSTAHIEPGRTDISRPSSGNRSSLSSTVSQKPSNRDALSSVTCAVARNRAIQKKQEQIEEDFQCGWIHHHTFRKCNSIQLQTHSTSSFRTTATEPEVRGGAYILNRVVPPYGF